MTATIERIEDHRSMNDAAYERERQQIRETYGDSGIEAAALRDQALAKLFHRSGWTQERLAAKEGCSRSRVTQRLTFGAFLAFATDRNIPRNLTEWRFRSYWARTSGGNERQRFAAVEKLIEEDVRVGASTAAKPQIGKPLVEKFGDGQWHSVGTIAKRLEAPEHDVTSVLELMRSQGTYQSHCQRKQVGKEFRYRIVRGAGKRVDVSVLMTELRPLLKGLYAEGQKNAATYSPTTVSSLTRQIEVLIEELAK